MTHHCSIYFLGSKVLKPDVVLRLVLCRRCILPCRNSRLLHLCCIKWSFLCGKVVALHLDSTSDIAYLCNQDCRASVFLSRLVCLILNLADKNDITLIPANIPIHLNVEAISHGRVGSWVTPASSHSLGWVSSFGSTRGRSGGILMYQSMLASLHLGTALPLGDFGLNTFNHPWTYQVSYVFHSSPSALVPLILSQVSGRTYHRSIKISCSHATLLIEGSLASYCSWDV